MIPNPTLEKATETLGGGRVCRGRNPERKLALRREGLGGAIRLFSEFWDWGMLHWGEWKAVPKAGLPHSARAVQG